MRRSTISWTSTASDPRENLEGCVLSGTGCADRASGPFTQKLAQLIRREWWVAPVCHGVAVRADRDEISHRIDLVLATGGGKRRQMVNVDQAGRDVAVDF